MDLRNRRELEVTNEKLQMLEQLLADLTSRPSPDAHIRKLSILSLKRVINQLKEEIIRFEIRVSSPNREPEKPVDTEQFDMAHSDELLKLIRQRRQEPTVSRAELEEQLGKN